MTPATQLRHWQRTAPGRKVHWGCGLVAMADGERSVFATGETTEDAARACLEAWYSGVQSGENREAAA